MKKSICIIPARGGSKRIRKKNIKMFFGKPIIYYAIRNAINSKLFSKIIVSTNNNEIKKIAKKNKAMIHHRSKHLSKDWVDTKSVIISVIKDLESKNISFDKVCCIYPTSVFFKRKEIISASKLLKKDTHFVFSATRYNHPIYRSFIKKGKNIKTLFPNFQKKKTQDFKIFYHDAAQFYFGWRTSWLKNINIFNGKSKFIEIPILRALDIDTQEDWDNAKIIWRNNKYKKQ